MKQIETLGRHFDSKKAQATYQAVRKVLTTAAAISGWKFHIFNQGSLANETAIKEVSDVDLVICAHIPSQQEAPQTHPTDDTSTIPEWLAFRDAVFLAIHRAPGLGKPSQGNKTIQIESRAPLLAVDVVVCFEGTPSACQSGRARKTPDPDTPIQFWTTETRKPILLTNFPLLHSAKITQKDRATGRMFRREIRAIKQLRTQLGSAASSYLIECALGLAPNENYTDRLDETHRRVTEWLAAHLDAIADAKALNGKMTIGSSCSHTELVNLLDLLDHLGRYPSPRQPPHWFHQSQTARLTERATWPRP